MPNLSDLNREMSSIDYTPGMHRIIEKELQRHQHLTMLTFPPAKQVPIMMDRRPILGSLMNEKMEGKFWYLLCCCCPKKSYG